MSRRSSHTNILTFAALPFAVLVAGLATAQFTQDVAPPWRFGPGAEYAGWESFTEPNLGDNLPDDPSSSSGAVLVQTRPGAVITGGGNIYHPLAAARFEIRDEVDCDLQEVWVQTSTWGSVLDRTSPALVYIGCDGEAANAPAPSVTVLANYPNPQGMGTNEELLFVWDLGAVASDVREYVVSFEAEVAHLSLDAVLLDARTDCASPQSCQLGTAYCFGDGSGTPCPCGNSGAADRGCANSFAPTGARLSAWGSTSLAAGDLVLTAIGAVPNQPGLFFQADAAVNGGEGTPFGDGLRCAGSGVVRLEIAVPDADGALQSSIDVGARGGASAGETKRYQLWYRDPIGGPCGAGFNLTNGLAIAWTL